jgi:hypothetical protein
LHFQSAKHCRAKPKDCSKGQGRSKGFVRKHQNQNKIQNVKVEMVTEQREFPPTPPAALHDGAGVDPMNTDSDDEPGGKENDDE